MIAITETEHGSHYGEADKIKWFMTPLLFPLFTCFAWHMRMPYCTPTYLESILDLSLWGGNVHCRLNTLSSLGPLFWVSQARHIVHWDSLERVEINYSSWIQIGLGLHHRAVHSSSSGCFALLHISKIDGSSWQIQEESSHSERRIGVPSLSNLWNMVRNSRKKLKTSGSDREYALNYGSSIERPNMLWQMLN